MALCAAQRSGFFARSPLAGGFLARRHGEDTALSPGRRDWLESRFGNAYGEAALAAVTEVASRRDASAAQVALAWVLRNPWVTSAIIGVRSRAQLHELIDASRLQLTESDLQLLDAATATEAVQIVPAPKRLGSAPLQLAQTG
jgi:aryl-alcohol dehydrogenase-like predicted oxidoreductase